MNQNTLNWYRGIGFPEALLNSAVDIISRVEKYYEMKFEDFFISNAQKDDVMDYTSVWLFTDQDAIECKNFLTSFDIDIVRYKRNVRYVNIITGKNDSLTDPTDNSVMKLSVLLADDVKCLFTAKGMNCKKLDEIARRYLKEYKSMAEDRILS
jgi:hypothetical protein